MPLFGRDATMKDDRLAGRRALVTGGGRRGGIGRAKALRLAAAGADVFVADFDSPADPRVCIHPLGRAEDLISATSAWSTHLGALWPLASPRSEGGTPSSTMGGL